MNREIHVRFWEGLRVRFPWATHLAVDLLQYSQRGVTEMLSSSGIPLPAYPQKLVGGNILSKELTRHRQDPYGQTADDLG